MATSSLQNDSAPANAPIEKFAVAHLWAALGDIPEVYGLSAAKGGLRALADAIERAEKGLPPLSIATRGERKDALQEALPSLVA